MIEWIQKRWFDFRMGHSTYLGFILSFVNFVLITYRMLLEQFTIFSSLLEFCLIFALAYIPSCIIVGHFHKTKQMKYDYGMQFEETPQIKEILRRLERIENKIEKN